MWNDIENVEDKVKLKCEMLWKIWNKNRQVEISEIIWKILNIMQIE